MVYYDSNIFISYFKKDDNVEEVSYLFETEFLHKYKIYFSAFVQLEAMFVFGNEKKLNSEEIKKSKEAFQHEKIIPITLSQETIEICYDLYENFELTHDRKDLIHVASAMQVNCKFLVTLDKKFINCMNKIYTANLPKVLLPSDLKTELAMLF